MGQEDLEGCNGVKIKRNYHGCLTRIAPTGVDWFRCDYCGEQGRFNDIHPTQCSHVYSVSEACGGDPNSNECKADCPAMFGEIAAAMADPKIYVAGTHGPKD